MLASLLLSLSLSDPTPPRLSWEAPAGCPDAAQVEGRAERLAGLESATASFHVRARVERSAAHPRTPWHLELVVVTGEGQGEGEQVRTLDAAECEALADVTALVLAFGLDPFGEAEPAMSEGEPVAVAPEPRASRTHRVHRPAPVNEPILHRESGASGPPRRSPHAGYDRVGFGLRLLAGGEMGALPGGSGGGRFAAALLTHRLRVEAHGSIWLPRPARLADGGGVGVDVRLATGGADLCVRLYAAGRLELPICAGAELGLMRADTVGTPSPQQAYSLYAAARLAPAISWRVADWVGLWLGVEGTVALSRPRFRFGEDEVYTPAPAGGRVLGGVEFGF